MNQKGHSLFPKTLLIIKFIDISFLMESTIKPVSIILKEELLRRKKKNLGYSLRAFSNAMGLSASFVSKVLSGKKQISVEKLVLIAGRLKLEGSTLEELSVHFSNPKKTNFEEVNLDHFKFISDWYYYALLELTTLRDFVFDKNWIAKKLNLSVELIERSLERLIRIELLTLNEKGFYYCSQLNLTNAGQKVPNSAHREHERQLLIKSIEAIDTIDFSERSHSSITMAIPSHRINEAREKIKIFQREMNELLQREGNRDSVYNLSISFFPLTKK